MDILNIPDNPLVLQLKFKMRRLLVALGYIPSNKGKTSGSRVIFKGPGKKPIMLHKLLPGYIIKGYIMKQVYKYLKSEGLI